MIYKFSKAADEKIKKELKPQMAADNLGGIARSGPFASRVAEQIRRRELGERIVAGQKKARRTKVAKVRAGY